MVRIFIISLFLIYVEQIFCEEHSIDPLCDSKLGRNINKNARSVKRYKRQEIDQDNSEDQVAQIDLTNFINEANEEGSYGNEYENQLSKDYNDMGSLDSADLEESFNTDIENYDNLDNNGSPHVDYSMPLSTNPKRFSFNKLKKRKNSIDNAESYGVSEMYHDDLIYKEKVHAPSKKSVLKKMRFPFFSLNKSNKSGALEKDSKKKVVCKECNRDKDNNTKQALTKAQGNVEVTQEASKDTRNYLKKKRSYNELLCPRCKKKFLAYRKIENSPDFASNEPIHNSRQYYQQRDFRNKHDYNEMYKDREYNNGISNINNYHEERIKRGDQITDKERQLKELDEVQRKIDNLEIKMPKFGRGH